LKSRIPFLALGLILCLFQGCSQKVCPAFESFYLLDEKVQKDHFSYFVDSIPRTDIAKVYKNKFGIGQEPFIATVINKIPPPIHSPFAKINTIEPVVIYPELPDSLEFLGDELMAAELDIPDSSAFKPDTTEVARNWHFNIDQENYFNYLIKKLKIPIEPVSTGGAELEDVENPDTSAIETEGVEGSGEKKGFLKGLFKRKKKESKSEEGTEPNQQDPKQNIGGEPE
jgi:hypothetical protein